MNRRHYHSDPGSVVQQRTEATVDRLVMTLRLALAAGENDLELQMRMLANEAGEYGRKLLLIAVDRCLRACRWPQMMPRPRQARSRLEMLGQVSDGELTIWLELLPPALLRVRLTHRETVWPHAEPLYSVDIEMEPQLWEQIRGAQ